MSATPQSTRAVLKTVIDVARFGFASVIDTLDLAPARSHARELACALHSVDASHSCKIIISQQLSIAKA